jgi:hypothetical protein
MQVWFVTDGLCILMPWCRLWPCFFVVGFCVLDVEFVCCCDLKCEFYYYCICIEYFIFELYVYVNVCSYLIVLIFVV